MLRATIWRELRVRLMAALLLLAPVVALIATSYAVRPRGSESPGPAAAWDYLAHLDATWFRLPGSSAVLLPVAVLLGAGGVLTYPRGDLLYALALPLSRRRWLLAYLAGAQLVLTVLVLGTCIAFAIGAWLSGASLAPGPLLLRSFAVLLAASAWIGISQGVLALVRRPMVAVAVLLGVVLVTPPTRFRLDLPARPSQAELPSWDPWTFADPRAWEPGVPLRSGLLALVLAGAGIMLALRRVETVEP